MSTEHFPMRLKNQDLVFCFTRGGDIRSISAADLQISQYRPQDGDPGIAGIWLRHRRERHITETIALIGSSSCARLSVRNGTQAVWCGEQDDIHWCVSLRLASSHEWTWTIQVRTKTPGEWDLVTAQDVALAPKAQALTSEPYISQYVAYRTVDDQRHGSVLAARQTMASAPVLPLLVTAMTPSARAVMTDGFDFYGPQVRGGEQARALSDADWDDGGVRQYEFGMMCVLSSAQTTTRESDVATWQQSFLLRDDYREDMTQACRSFADQLPDTVDPASPDVMQIPHNTCDDEKTLTHDGALTMPVALVNGRILNNDELLALLHGMAHDVETDADGSILSYFMKDAAHVVSSRKEMLVDRSHGQILLAGLMNDDGEPRVGEPVLATTAWMPGVFGSQTVMGNSNLHTLVSIHRDALNLFRMNGVRIIVHDHEGPYMLGVPSAFIMELGRVTWIYQFDDDVMRVTLMADVHKPVLVLHVSSTVRRRITIMMGITGSWRGETDGDRIRFTPSAEPVATACPDLVYDISSTDLHPRWDEGRQHVLFTGEVDEETVILAAGEQGAHSVDEMVRKTREEIGSAGLDTLEDRYVTSFSHFDRSFHVSHGGRDSEAGDGGTGGIGEADGGLEEFNLLVPWLTQNALVHLLSPHGLEQYSGAAWGTRDVLQGPLELCLALHHCEPVRRILLRVFAKQAQDGSLPQWFMFDQYTTMFQNSSHDDIPIWPLLATAEYLEASGDIAFLDRHVPFRTDDSSGTPTAPTTTTTVMDHLLASLRYVTHHCVPGTKIYSYGEGDWDDTLQPAQEEMKKTMASTWTVALLYQATASLGHLLSRNGYPDQADQFLTLAAGIKGSYANDFLFDGVLAGYVSFASGRPEPLIHPSDHRTGMKYRLIPMTRAIISGIVSAPVALNQEDIIERYLRYPDGVRLMDHPAQFHDGIPHIFKRAEQSSFVGREVGLMYTHAHIRYAEALAALGRPTVADELLRISPVDQFRHLSTSQPRQRNCYFASSDADFRTRYEADRQWGRLKEGAANPVGVKGGWRVYSSGPGIYISQLVRHVFGLDIRPDGVVFDPLMRPIDDRTILTFRLWGKDREIMYHVRPDNSPVTVVVEGKPVTGTRDRLAYRPGGLDVSREQIGEATRIDVWLGTARAESTASDDKDRAVDGR